MIAQLVAAVARLQLIAADAHVLDRIGRVADARALPVAHLAAADEVGDELEPLAVPREEERTRRRLAIELLDRRRREASAAGGACAGAISACRMPDGHSTRTTSAPGRAPRPNTKSAGAAGGVAADVSSRARRLPARIWTFAPTAAALLDAAPQLHAQRRVAARRRCCATPRARRSPASHEVGVAVADRDRPAASARADERRAARVSPTATRVR